MTERINRVCQIARNGFCGELELDTRFDRLNFKSMLDKLDKLFLLVQLECKDFFIAGGCLRDALIGKDYNDIDVWAASQADFEIFRDYLHINQYSKTYDSKFAETYKKRQENKAFIAWNTVQQRQSTSRKNAVQVIKSFANQQEQFSDFIIRTLTNFDFTINQIAYQPAEEMIYVSQLFLEDVVNKKLRSQNILNHSQFILQRAKKFSLEGWMLHPELFAALSKLPKDICSCGENHFESNHYIWTMKDAEEIA